MLLANFNGKEHLRHRAVSLRQHGFLVLFVMYCAEMHGNKNMLLAPSIGYVYLLKLLPYQCHNGAAAALQKRHRTGSDPDDRGPWPRISGCEQCKIIYRARQKVTSRKNSISLEL